MSCYVMIFFLSAAIRWAVID